MLVYDLQELAVRYLALERGEILLVWWGALGVGGLLAAAFRSKPSLLISRSTFFAITGLLAMAVGLARLPLLDVRAAAIAEHAWMLVLVELAATAAAGFALCRLAAGRSLDAFGTGSRAFLAFFPLFNFWLMLQPSRKSQGGQRLDGGFLLAGTAGIALGCFGIAIERGITTYVRYTIEQAGEALAGDMEWRGVLVRKMIREKGLEATLDLVIAEEALAEPRRIDPVTFIVEIERNGTLLRYRYAVNAVSGKLSKEFLDATKRRNCAVPVVRALLDAGAMLEHAYYDRAGLPVGSVRTRAADCT